MSQIQVNTQKMDFIIHEYDRRVKSTLKLIGEELSPENVELIKAYDIDMVSSSLAKATRLKNLQIILNLSRMIKKNWHDVTEQDIKDLVYHIMQTYSTSGQETNVNVENFLIIIKVQKAVGPYQRKSRR